MKRLTKWRRKWKKETNEREKEIAEWEAGEWDGSETEWELDEEEANQLLKDTLIDINAPFCHYIKPDGVAGKEFMIKNTLLRHCVGCNDEEQCWSVGQLKDLIEEERKTFLNQDY